MKNSFKMIRIILFLIIICFSFTMCTPPEPTGDILLINQYHVPITRVIIGRGICEFNISQEDSVFLSVEFGEHEIYVITNDNIVSNSLKVVVVDNVIEIITLNINGKLVHKE